MISRPDASFRRTNWLSSAAAAIRQVRSLAPIVAAPGARTARPSAVADERTSIETRFGTWIQRWWPELGAALIVLSVLGYLLHILTRYALPPSGDSGQWLTIARFYLRDAMPAERTATTMPPLVPVLLAGISFVAPTRPLAVVVLAALCFLALSAVAFMLGRRMTGSATGGLLAVVFVAIAQPQLFEVIAVGAYPQLVAIIGMAVCLLGLLALCESSTTRGWTVLQVGVALTLFSHTPSATVLIPPLGLCLVYLLWSSSDRRELLRASFMSLRPVLLLWGVFILINRDVVFGYANVPATFDLKGPDLLVSTIWTDDAQRLVFGLGAFMACALPFLGTRARAIKANSSVMLLLWIVALAAMVTLAAARHVNTDYPRFIAYFIVPLGLTAAVGLHAFGPSRLVTVGIVVVAALFAGAPALAHLDDSARFYGMNAQSDDLVSAVDWLNTSGEEGGVIGGTRDTKWLQALTGRSALLYLRRISITRPSEVDRAIAAEMVQRSSGGFETGELLATQNAGGEDYGKLFPPGLRIDAYHLGMYDPAVSLDDRSTRVHVSAFGAIQNVPLAAMNLIDNSSSQTTNSVTLRTRFRSDDAMLQVVREAHAATGDPNSVVVDYQVAAPAGAAVESLSIALKGLPTLVIKAGSPETTFDVRRFDGSTMTVRASTGWTKSAPPKGENAWLTWRRVRLTLTFPPGESRIDGLRLYDPADLLKQYGIRYIVDRDGDGAAFPIIRDYGLKEVYGNDEYHVYQAPVH